jgi:diphthine synthase
MTKGCLIFIGLGLYDEKDISLKGLEEIKNCDNVFAEFYTARLMGADIKKIEKTFGKNITILTRQETEKGDKILNIAREKTVVLLTCGDPMTATTHVDIRLRAENLGLKTKIIHGSSIVTAVPGLLGLQNYKFGRTTTLAENREMGLHTLVLLDIQDDKKRYMTANEGISLLLKMEEKHKENIIKQDSIICVVARAGSSEPVALAGIVENLISRDFGLPLHSIVIPGKLHFMEIEALKTLAQLPAQQVRKLQKL